jgi:hypothetical protein
MPLHPASPESSRRESGDCTGMRLPVRRAARIVIALACLLAASADGGRQGVARAAGKSRPGPARFLDNLLGKQQPTPDLIPAPMPPTAEEAERAARYAAVPKSTPTPKPLPVQKTPAAARQPAAPSAPQRVPTWQETRAFGAALHGAATRVLSDAVDPNFKPRQRPAPETVTVAPRPQSRRQTPPLVVTRLQPSGMPAPRTARFERLRVRIAQTLATYQRRPLNTADNTPWEVMHGFIAFGIPTQLRVGGPAGDLVNAIGWSNMGGRCRGQVMLAASGERLTALKGIGVQGHSAQYLAILAQCRVAANSPITLQSRTFTVADLIEEEKLSCKAGTELTFALIALAHYLPTDAEWRSRDGQTWSLERLVEEEIVQPIRGAPCGGTHRLFGLAYGCQRRLRATGQLDGAYLRADKYVRDYQNFTLSKLQNRDGSFSTEWFKYPADRDDDVDRKIQTTGHILEWLVASLDQERLYEPRIVAAAEFLTYALAREPSREWKLGPLGHALHALNIYQERAWGVVLPGGIAAFNGPMKAAAAIATRPDGPQKSTRR